MKPAILAVLLLLAVAALVTGAPAESEHPRERRITCDLLSMEISGNKLNDSACAAGCIFRNKGYKGGHCEKGVCKCRK